MAKITGPKVGDQSIGMAVGQALAGRIVELAQPEALIVDNSPTIVRERRKKVRPPCN